MKAVKAMKAKAMITSNPIESLSDTSGLTFSLSKLLCGESYFDGGVYLPQGHSYRFAVMNAMRLIEQLRALAISEEMAQEERERFALEAWERQKKERRKAEQAARVQESNRLRDLIETMRADRDHHQQLSQTNPQERARCLSWVARVNAAIAILQG